MDTLATAVTQDTAAAMVATQATAAAMVALQATAAATQAMVDTLATAVTQDTAVDTLATAVELAEPRLLSPWLLPPPQSGVAAPGGFFSGF